MPCATKGTPTHMHANPRPHRTLCMSTNTHTSTNAHAHARTHTRMHTDTHAHTRTHATHALHTLMPTSQAPPRRPSCARTRVRRRKFGGAHQQQIQRVAVQHEVDHPPSLRRSLETNSTWADRFAPRALTEPTISARDTSCSAPAPCLSLTSSKNQPHMSTHD